MQRLALTARYHRIGAALAGVALLAAGPALAQDEGAHPVDSALEMMDLKTQAGPMPDFVNQSRGSRQDDTYIPIGAKPPARSLKPKSAADVKALTAELDAARDAQLHGKRPKPMSTGAPAKPAKIKGQPLKLQSGTTQATNH